jgi:uncharacterized membrane protein required for colicin V production
MPIEARMGDHGWALVTGWAAPLGGAAGLPFIDWLALCVVLAGIVGGAMSGLLRSVGTLLWLLAALWLGCHLAATFVSWMPNTAQRGDPGAILTAFGLIAAAVMVLPVVARIIGGAAGKKKDRAQAKHKAFGAVVGLVSALLVLVWMAPYMHRYVVFARGWPVAKAPRMASAIADSTPYLFPDAHRLALARTINPEKEWVISGQGATTDGSSK